MNYHHVFEGHADRIFSLAVCTLADGSRYAASGSNDRTLRIWSLDTLQLVRVIECSDFVWRAFIVLCPRALVVAYISAEQKIQVWDLLTGEMVITFYGRLIFSGTISLFKQPIAITATGEEDVSFVDVCTGQTLYTLKGGFEKALRAVVSPAPHANLVFTTWNSQNRRSTIQSYELPDELPRSSSGRTSPTDIDRSSMSILFEGDSRDSVTSVVITVFNSPLLCSGHHDFQIRVWSLQTKQLLRILTGHSDYVGCVAAWKGNQPLIVSGASDGEVKVWNVHSGELVATGLGHTRDVWGLAVTAQSSSPYHNYNAHNPGRLLASNYTHYHQTQLPIIVTGSTDRTIRLWNINEMLMDRCWLRRKHFCLFLSYLGFLSAEGSSSAIIAFSNKYGLCGGDSSSGTKYSGSGDADITECGEVVFDCCISEVQSADGLRFGQLISRILESYILESFEKFDDSDLQQQTLDSMFFWQQSNSTEVSEEAADWPFDVQGMAPRQTLKLPGMNSANELILIGTGMRKVNLIVVAFDVYRIGIYASKSAVAKAIEWNKSHAEDYSLSMALVSNKAATSTERALDFSATLKFSRAVSKAEFLAAFNVSFYGCNEEDIASFINSLGHLIDDTGVLVGDEVTYYWFNNGDFAVGRGADKYEATNTTDEIRLRLLEVYIDPVRSVSFQLQECVHNNLDNLSSMKFLS